MRLSRSDFRYDYTHNVRCYTRPLGQLAEWGKRAVSQHLAPRAQKSTHRFSGSRRTSPFGCDIYPFFETKWEFAGISM